ncbi:methyltransferase family protein [Paenarthrobacter sp. NPDC018779]|uniref:methyltransferase family protein n=1 Tax=Paenarthrobacter sp. NPDC018779 TaxID=3364375 RepID=UPI0037CCC154
MRRVFGMVLVVTGAGITVWAVAERRMRSNGSFALSHPEDLVTTGPYSLSRHPMYLGWWLIHSGIAIFRGSSGALATLPAGILVEHVGVLWEEKALLTKFGYKYAEYMRAVPRYVGNPASRLMRADKPQ